MRLILLIGAITISLQSLGQRTSIGLPSQREIHAVAPIDTLGLFDFMEAQHTSYNVPGCGFAFGTNCYFDQAKAQTYDLDTVQGRYLKGVLVLFDGVYIGSGFPDSSKVELIVYTKGKPAYPQSGAIDTTAGPDSVVAYSWVTLSQINTNGFTYFNAQDWNAVLKGRHFFAIRLIQVLPGDSVSVLSSADGEGGQQYRAWELNAFGEWVNVGHPVRSWALDVNLAIFPVVDHNISADIAEPTQVSPLYPNPTSGWVSVVKPNATVTVSDFSGKEIFKGLSDHNGMIDLTTLNNGVYLLAFEQFSTPKRLIINH